MPFPRRLVRAIPMRGRLGQNAGERARSICEIGYLRCMRIRFDAALEQQEIWAEGEYEIETILDGSLEEDGAKLLLATIDRPVLVTDPYRVSLLPPRRRDLVHTFLGLPRRVIEYDGVELDFDQSQFPRVWSPSIDTLLVCRAVRALLPSL